MRFGETARGICRRWLIAAAAVVFAAFTAMLALGAISPLGVQGANHPIDDNGQGVGFQQSSMVTNVTVTNTPNGPGEAARYTVAFVTGEVLQANVDTIVFDIDSSVWVPVSIPADAIRISASAVTGGGQANQSVALSEDPNWEYGFEGRDIYTITVPDMDASESSRIESIDARATVTVTFLISAGLINPTESGSYDFTVSTSKEAAGVKATFTIPLTLSINDKSGNRNTPITLIGRGFKKGATVTVYLDRTRDDNGQIVNMPDGVRTPGTDVDLELAGVDSDGTFTVNNAARVPPFAPIVANQINAIDDGNPPNHYNGMGGQTPVTFTIEPLLYVSSSLVALGGEVEFILVDWPATDQVMDHVTADAQGVDRVVQSAVTIAGIPQEIISGEGQIGPDNEHTFLVRVGATVPAGIHELRVRTYTADQMMSDVPGGASDAKNIKIWDRFCPLDPARTPGSVAGDRAALVALYNATDGANWTDNTNWLTNAPIFQWYGVSADAEGRVCALNLHGNGLSGEMPVELGGLTNLTGLYLNDNQLSGEIPEGLGGLTNLTGLYLNDNQLSGEIPPTLGGLTNLHRLFLSGNQLIGGIPEGLGGLTNLTELHLSYNQLSGDIPPELGGLANLTELHLYANQLNGEMPAELGRLTSLEALFLSHNRLSGEIPPELGGLTNLTGLYLGDNELSGEIPPELGGLTNLTGLYLSDNELSGEIPPELGGLTNLTGLYLNDNQLSGEIPEGLGGLTNLTRLHLYANQLNGEMSAELGGLTSLEALFLSHNRLSGEIPPELGGLTNLRSLHISDNQLSGEIPTELGNLTSLVSLILHANQLNEEIPAELGNLTSLTELDLSGNQLSGEIPKKLGNLTNLAGLFLNDNQLSGDVPKELGNLANLRFVYLSNNQLTGCVPASLWGVANNDFAELGLSFCDMSGPGIVAGDRAALVALYNATGGANWQANSGWLTDAPLNQWHGVETDNTRRVTGLHLSWNRLSGEIPEELGNLTNLTRLYLGFNELSGAIPAELGSLTSLATLRLDRNLLSGDIPAGLGNLTNLTELHLSYNQLSGEMPEELGNLTNLTTLELNDNQLSKGIPEELGSLTNLEILRLSSNRLTGCVPASLRGVAIHDLAELGLPFCDMLDGSPVVVIRFVSEAGAPVRLGSLVSLEAAFNEPVTGFSLEDISVANGVAGNFAGSGSVYAFEVTPNAIGEVTMDIAAGVAQDAGENGNIAVRLSFGIPYDDDGNGAIGKPEVIAAIDDYLFGDGSIAKSHLIDLINLYLSGPAAP